VCGVQTNTQVRECLSTTHSVENVQVLELGELLLQDVPHLNLRSHSLYRMTSAAVGAAH
jgi:hypothetical protein